MPGGHPFIISPAIIDIVIAFQGADRGGPIHSKAGCTSPCVFGFQSFKLGEGCKQIFQEKIDGAKADRPELRKMIDQIRKGDVIVTWKLDRLGRSLRDLVNLVNEIQDKGAGLKSLNDSIDTTTPQGKLTFHLFASLAEFERDIIRERTKAGLEAARVAAIRGYEVHIFEKEDRIGGLLNIVHIPAGRHEFYRMLEDYQYWIQKYGITVHHGIEVTTDIVKEFNPDFVFLATGTLPINPPIPGIDGEHVYWANDALNGDVPIGKNNVIIGGGATGIELAIFIAKYGKLSLEAYEFLTQYKVLEIEDGLSKLYKGNKKVTVMEMLPRCGANLGKSTKWVLLDKCDMLGVKFLTGVNVTNIGKDSISYSDASDKEQVLNDVDAVYYATGVKPNNELYKNIQALGFDVERIGDAKKPATVLEAVGTAFKIANNI